MKEIKKWAMQDASSTKPKMDIQSINGFVQNMDAINLCVDDFGREPTPT